MATVQLSNQQVKIAREGDFQDFLTFADTPEKLKLRKWLEEQTKSAGTMRSYANDMLRSRLSQLRKHLAVV